MNLKVAIDSGELTKIIKERRNQNAFIMSDLP